MRFTQRIKEALAARYRARFADGRFRSRAVLGTPGADGLPVLMCAWARIPRSGEVLETLDRQLHSPPVDLYIWNNRRAAHRELERTVQRFRREGALRSVSLVRSPFNLGSIARFYFARQLWLAGRRGPFVVFDDDQRLPPDFLQIAVRSYEPGTAAGVWAWRIVGDYWERERAMPGDRVDHLGPGGMVADLELLSDRAFFDGVPLEHWYLDDVWLSHYAPSRGFELRRLPTDVEFVDDDHNIYLSLAEQKVRFHEWLRAGS